MNIQISIQKDFLTPFHLIKEKLNPCEHNDNETSLLLPSLIYNSRMLPSIWYHFRN